MKKYNQIKAVTNWLPFVYESQDYPLSHLNVHEVNFKGAKESFSFVVTYGLHCFAKNESPFSIPIEYTDSFESRKVCMERYEASKFLRSTIERFDSFKFGNAGNEKEKFFCIDRINSKTGEMEPYKICFVAFKEMRLYRIHITTAFFLRDKPDDQPDQKWSIYKLATDLKKKKKTDNIPKEATRNTIK